MNTELLQELCLFINPTKISDKKYNMPKSVLYDIKGKRYNTIPQQKLDILKQYFNDMINEQDVKDKLKYVILQYVCTKYKADYQNIKHYLKGRVLKLSQVNIVALDVFFEDIKNALDIVTETDNSQHEQIDFELPPMPPYRYKDKVRFKYECSVYNHDGFLSADPVLNYKKEWVAPIFIYDVGVVYIPCNDMQLLRKLSSK